MKFRDCHRTFLTFKPPSLLVSQIAPTAANFAGRPRLLPPGRTCFVASARTGYAIRPFQAIDGERTFTFPDLRSCRLLRWDRSRARPAVGGGFPLLLFRLQGGFTIPPWRRFPKPPYNAGRPNFSGPVSSLGHFVDEPSHSPRSSSAGSHTPRLRMVC